MQTARQTGGLLHAGAPPAAKRCECAFGFLGVSQNLTSTNRLRLLNGHSNLYSVKLNQHREPKSRIPHELWKRFPCLVSLGVSDSKTGIDVRIRLSAFSRGSPRRLDARKRPDELLLRPQEYNLLV